MTPTDGAFAQWLSQAQIHEERLTAEQRGLLRAAFAFRQRLGQFLQRRGFGWEAVEPAVERLWRERAGLAGDD